MKFINRAAEVEFLENAFSSPQAQLIILYGRRRIGKTELLLHFAKNKPYIYFLAAETSEKDNLHNLFLKMAEFFDKDVLKLQETWSNLFSYVAQKKERVALIIDEFPYLVTQNKAISSIFQNCWDTYLKDSNVMLILNGSSISMMEEHTLLYKAPLYGRRTGQWKVTSLKFKELKHFFSNYSLEDLILTFGAIDSIPGYLKKFDPELKFWENVEYKLLTKGTFLYDEVDFLLKQEFREPKVYKNCLQAIALGSTKFSEILNSTGIEKTQLFTYLDTLASLNIIEKRVPLLDSLNSKKSRYYLKDNLFKFYFRFSLPNRSSIEEGKTKAVLEKIKMDYSNYIGRFVFENVCKELLWNNRDFEFEKIANQWGSYVKKQETKSYEIDLVAINENFKSILFAECKWSEGVDAQRVLNELKEKAIHVQWHNESRKEEYAIFAKSFKNKKTIEKAYLYDLQEMQK